MRMHNPAPSHGSGSREARLPRRALFVSAHYPSDAVTGAHGVFQRMSMFVRALSDSFQSVKMLFYVPSDVDLDRVLRTTHKEELARKWGGNIEITLVPAAPARRTWFSFYVKPTWSLLAQGSYVGTAGAPQLQAFEAELASSPDLVFVHRLYSMAPLLLTRKVLPPIALDLDEIEYRWFLRSIATPPNWPLKKLLYLQVPAFYLGEKRALRQLARIFVASPGDRDFLAKRWHLTSARFCPNATVVPSDPPSPSPEKTLLFLGSYASAPNADAAERFISRIWPLVHIRCPEARLIIAGTRPRGFPATPYVRRASNSLVSCTISDRCTHVAESSSARCAQEAALASNLL